MGYNIIDLIKKAKKVAIKKRTIYENILQKKRDISSIKTVSTILINQINNTIQYYEDFVKEIEPHNFEEIDFSTYDKISFLIDEFCRRIYEPEINNTRELLKFSLALEIDTCSLFIDIQGRFVKNASDVNTDTYRILSDMINKKTEFIAILKRTLK